MSSAARQKQFYEVENRLPDAVMACVGGGSNSIGMFADFIEEKGVKLIGVEAAGKGVRRGTCLCNGTRRAGSPTRYAFLSPTG